MLTRTILLSLSLSLFIHSSSTASPGDLDVSFAGTGKTRFGFGGGATSGSAVVAQGDGKIIVAGSSLQVGKPELSVFRYNSDGSLDTSFDQDGFTTIAIAGSEASSTGVALQADGKIVVCGYRSVRVGDTFNFALTDFVLIRLNANGTMDSTFGVDGIVITDINNSTDVARAMTLQVDGRIVVVGSASFEFSAVRYNFDGSLDTSFDGDGKIIIPVNTESAATAVLFQADGKLVLAGYANSSPGRAFAVVRLHGNGTLDTSFGGTGKVTTLILSNENIATGIALQPGNNTVGSPDKLVVAGYSSDAGSSKDFAVVRYNMNGSLDTSFDGDGKVTTPIGTGDDEAVAVKITGSGLSPRKIVVAGTSTTGGNEDFAVVRYNANGSLDTTMDNDGKVTTPISSVDDGATGMTISFNRYVITGYSQTNSATALALVRYNSDGSLDTSFDEDGKRIDNIGNTAQATAYAVAIQQNGGIVVGGNVQIPDIFGTIDFALIRLNSNGLLDTSFGNGGRVTTDLDFSSRNNSVAGLAIQPDGKIVAAGYGYYTFQVITPITAFAFIRYHTNGAVDISATTKIGDIGSEGRAVVLQSDGKIVMAGFSFVGNLDSDFAVVRYNADGSLDGSFDGDGIVTTSLGTATDVANAVALQPDGKIVVGGTAGANFAVARYNPDGSLDTFFNFDGKVTTPVPANSARGNAIAVRDGKTLVAGESSGGFTLARYTADGSLDISFDGDGIVTNDLGNSGSLSMAIQGDGRVLVAGYGVENGSSDFDFRVMRLNTDGSVDSSYLSGGASTVDFRGGNDTGFALAIDSAGRAVIAGDSEGLFGVARLLGDFVPRITIARTNSDVELSWPTAALGFLLQSTPNLNAPIIWNDVTDSRTTNRVVIPSPSDTTYFRLKL